MKNLFKNLMLVAVAAMAFTACTETNDEVNAVSKITRYEFTANIADDTRSGFAEKEEGATAYKSEWFGNETIKLFVTNYNGYYVEKTATISADGKFTLELENAPESFDMTVCSPADSWESENSCTIPTEQTPLANSVDPKAHVLKSIPTYIQTGSESISMSPQDACYGKMTVNAPESFEIGKVEVSFNEGKVYTLNATNVENNVFWFAVDSAIEVSTFTVTAYNEEGNAITKTVDVPADRELKFQWGRVSTFSVSKLEAVVVEPEGLVFTSASVTASSGDAYAYFNTENGDILKLNPYHVFENETWPVGTHVITAATGYVYPGLGQGYSTFNGTDVEGGEIVVSVKNNKYYIEFNNLVDKNGNTLIAKGIFEGEITGLQVPDARTPLPTPNVTATANGNIITLSWEAVTGAREYYVFCSSTGSISPITTTETTVNIEAAYSTEYEFMVTAKADDSDPVYKSSEAKTIKVSTEKDPNVFADYILDYVTVSSNYFEFNHDYHNGQANTKTSLRIYMHADDKGSNFINPGHYTCLGQGANTPSSAGKVNLRYCTDTWEYYYSTANTSATLDVSIENGEYVIIATIDGKAWGYKGLPDKWVVPSEGGDEPVNPDPDPDQPEQGEDDELGTVNNPYTFTTCIATPMQYPVLEFSGAEDGATLRLESNTSYGLPTGVKQLGDNGWWSSGHSYSLGEIDPGYSYSSIDQNANGSYIINYIMITSGSKTVFYRYSGGPIF